MGAVMFTILYLEGRFKNTKYVSLEDAALDDSHCQALCYGHDQIISRGENLP